MRVGDEHEEHHFDDEGIEVEVEIVRETEAAWLVSNGDERYWLPKSQVTPISDPDPELGDFVAISVPEWLAENEGLV